MKGKRGGVLLLVVVVVVCALPWCTHHVIDFFWELGRGGEKEKEGKKRFTSLLLGFRHM